MLTLNKKLNNWYVIQNNAVKPNYSVISCLVYRRLWGSSLEGFPCITILIAYYCLYTKYYIGNKIKIHQSQKYCLFCNENSYEVT